MLAFYCTSAANITAIKINPIEMVDFVQKCEISQIKMKKQQWERQEDLYHSEKITQNQRAEADGSESTIDR
jgi:hypothetical protein